MEKKKDERMFCGESSITHRQDVISTLQFFCQSIAANYPKACHRYPFIYLGEDRQCGVVSCPTKQRDTMAGVGRGGGLGNW